MLGVQWLDSSSGEEIQGVPFATGQSRSLEDQRNGLVQKQPAGSFCSEVGIGLSKIPGCLLRAIKKPQEQKRWWEGSPSLGRSSRMRFPPAWSSSLLLLPWTPTAAGASRAAPRPPDIPRPRGRAGAAAHTIHGSVLTPRDQTLLEHLAWPPGKQEKQR